MIKLHHGDCLETLPAIPNGLVDMVLCDPPYGIDFQSARRPKTERFDKILNDKTPFTAFIKHTPNLLKPSGCGMIFTRWDVQQIVIDELLANGITPKNVIIWDKGIHGMGDLKRSFGSRYESIVFFANKDFRFNGKRPVDIIKSTRVSAGKLLHPNEKPVDLLSYLIEKCCVEGGVVLDPCMGSGSTGIACVRTRRRFIGIELDETYFNLSNERINKELNSEHSLQRQNQ